MPSESKRNPGGFVPTPLDRELSQRVRSAREIAGYSQEELAHRLKISVRTLSRVENCETEIGIQLLAGIERELGPIYPRLGSPGKPGDGTIGDPAAVPGMVLSASLDEDEARLLRLYRELAPEERDSVLGRAYVLSERHKKT